jgi:hypothetical protein
MNRLFLLLLLVCATFVTPPLPALSGPITVAPGVAAGDQYRLAFVTSTNTDATTSSIAYYNVFVNIAANLEPALSSLGTTWTAIASTAMVAARDNTNTNPVTVGLPIYNLAGQLIATSNADLWEGNLSASISYDEHGAPPLPGYTEVWTGTGSTGIPDDPTDPLGASWPVWGSTKSATSDWIDTGGYYPASGNHTLYAISGPLTVVPGDVNRDGVVNDLDTSLLASHWLQSGVGIPGDANGDGKVNGLDFSMIASNWLKNAGGGTVRATVVPGDVNHDGVVNGLDINLLASNWMQTGTGVAGDANGDGIVNGLDISLIASNWLQPYGGGASGAAAVPEPSSVILAALGVLALLACRRRR